MSIRRASKAVNISLSVYYYKQKPREEDAVIIAQLEHMAEKRPTYGFRKMYHLLRSKGHRWNHKRVRRVYVMMGLNIRRKRK